METFIWTIIALTSLKLLSSIFCLATGAEIKVEKKHFVGRIIVGTCLLIWAFVTITNG